mgnify:CR=1 FL=1
MTRRMVRVHLRHMKPKRFFVGDRLAEQHVLWKEGGDPMQMIVFRGAKEDRADVEGMVTLMRAEGLRALVMFVPDGTRISVMQERRGKGAR